MSDTVEPEVLEAEIVPEHTEHEPPAPSTAVARRERRSEVIRPLNADQLIESFAEYQDLLPRLLSPSDYQSTGKDKDGNDRKFVKKSGWRKIATAFDLDVQIIRSHVERDEHGQPRRAEVWARAIAPSGRAMDGDGYCSVEEERFGKQGDAEWKVAKARAKLENDLRGTATTRAMNRAISGLVGMGEVSAEEMGAGDQAQPGPAWAEEASPERKHLALDSLSFVVGSEETAKECLVAVKDALGVVPEGIAVALSRIARVVQEKAAA
jgi:hypothetical protein